MGMVIMKNKGDVSMETSAEYTTRESTIHYGTFYYCHNCGNRMFSVSKDKLKYNNCECPKCKKILIYKED